jgi:hypothetical protein
MIQIHFINHNDTIQNKIFWSCFGKSCNIYKTINGTKLQRIKIEIYKIIIIW